MHPATGFASADPEICCCCCGNRNSASCRDKFQARSVCGLSLTVFLPTSEEDELQGKTHKLVKVMHVFLDTPSHTQADYKHDGSISNIPS